MRYCDIKQVLLTASSDRQVKVWVSPSKNALIKAERSAPKPDEASSVVKVESTDGTISAQQQNGHPEPATDNQVTPENEVVVKAEPEAANDFATESAAAPATETVSKEAGSEMDIKPDVTS